MTRINGYDEFHNLLANEFVFLCSLVVCVSVLNVMYNLVDVTLSMIVSDLPAAIPSDT